ncbi:LysR family transcriptional regulator [Candidatus Uabimicrobium sp. HlEnr_7]|uniref:LysR family transcriptional regulator n=1 Tax=Candidatus Uabimicrobium helgolandensis TaxID=3095367 RepID=UPI003556C4D3
MIDLNLYLFFVTLVKHKNLTRAAEAMGMSQPAASNALKRLRNFFKDPLFVRSRTGMVPTLFAENLFTHIAPALEKLDQAHLLEKSFSPQMLKTKMRISLSDLAGCVLLSKLTKKLHVCAPLIDLEILPIRVDCLENDLQQKRLDLAIGVFPAFVDRLLHVPLWEEKFHCLVSCNHPEIQNNLSLKDYTKYQHILVSPGGGKTSIIDTQLKKLGLSRRVAVMVPNFLIALMVLADSDYILTIPKSVPIAEEYNLKSFVPPVKAPQIPVRLFWHEVANHSPEQIWLRTLIQDLVKDIVLL